jgi:hypothetical protein
VSETIAEYWERRYRAGKRGSGPGSQGAEAERKAAFINALVAEHGVNRIVDWGCGDAAIALCEERVTLPRRTWVRFDGWKKPDLPPAQLALSLDVIFHLTEDRLYRRHLRLLFGSAPLVCIHSSNRDEPGEAHVLHREFVRDVPAGWDVLYRSQDERDIGFWVFRRTS